MALISSNSYLTVEEMHDNAQYILDSLVGQGWTKQAVCGLLGNAQTESTMNPGLWESMIAGNMSGGFGLVQWTPATNFTNWADTNSFAWGDINGQITRILYEVANNLQWISTSGHPMTFGEFTQSTLTAGELAMFFIANYERPLEPNQPIRATQADYWYATLTGGSPPVIATTKKKMPLYMYKLF